MQAKGVRKIAQRRVDGRDDRVTARAVGEDEVQTERMELRAFEVDLVCAGPETASVEKVKALEAYVAGVSTRRVDDLVRALGIEGISRSEVSRM